MKAVAVLAKERKVGLIDRLEPLVETPTDVKLRVLRVGVCGTDREIAEFQYGAPPPASDRLVLGHECLAEVVDAGNRVKDLRPGDLAVVMVRRPCPHEGCRACRAGRPDFCLSGDFTERGIKERHGFMSEFIVDDGRYLIPVPRELREVAVLAEPLSVAEKAFAQAFEMQDRLPWIAERVRRKASFAGSTAVVLGAGPIGVLGAMFLVNAGFRTTVFSREASSSANALLVTAIGASYVSSVSDDPEGLCRSLGNIDLLYEATGASRFSFKMLPYLGRNGIYIFTGIPGRKEPVEVDTGRFMRDLVLKNQVIFGTVNADREAFGSAVRDLAIFRGRWPGVLESMISDRWKPEQFGEALFGARSGIKHVITFDQEES